MPLDMAAIQKAAQAIKAKREAAGMGTCDECGSAMKDGACAKCGPEAGDEGETE